MIPKFRAWWQHPKYSPEGKMYNVGGVMFANQEDGEPEYILEEKPTEIGLMEGDYDKIGWNDAKYCQLMQSTGLFDKNGVEIFEGDILKVKSGATFIVRWWNKYGMFYYICSSELNKEDPAFITVWDIEKNKILIIGNIFENPELLET